jgi:hypothetical protein
LSSASQRLTDRIFRCSTNALQRTKAEAVAALESSQLQKGWEAENKATTPNTRSHQTRMCEGEMKLNFGEGYQKYNNATRQPTQKWAVRAAAEPSFKTTSTTPICIAGGVDMSANRGWASVQTRKSHARTVRFRPGWSLNQADVKQTT